MRRTIIAGNWKMNKTAEETEAFCRRLLPLSVDNVDIVFDFYAF